MERKVLQYRFLGVAECNVVKIHGSGNRLPILTIGIQQCAVFLNHLRGVLNVRLGGEYIGDSFRSGLTGLQVCKDGRKVPNGLEEHIADIHKEVQRANGEHPGPYIRSAGV